MAAPVRISEYIWPPIFTSLRAMKATIAKIDIPATNKPDRIANFALIDRFLSPTAVSVWLKAFGGVLDRARSGGLLPATASYDAVRRSRPGCLPARPKGWLLPRC